jgi:large subunit ribosomal protein L13
LDEVIKNSAEDAIRMAVKGMLPKNRLGKKMLTKLKIYKDAEHPHQAQNPSIVDI